MMYLSSLQMGAFDSVQWLLSETQRGRDAFGAAARNLAKAAEVLSKPPFEEEQVMIGWEDRVAQSEAIEDEDEDAQLARAIQLSMLSESDAPSSSVLQQERYRYALQNRFSDHRTARINQFSVPASTFLDTLRNEHLQVAWLLLRTAMSHDHSAAKNERWWNPAPGSVTKTMVSGTSSDNHLIFLFGDGNLVALTT